MAKIVLYTRYNFYVTLNLNLRNSLPNSEKMQSIVKTSRISRHLSPELLRPGHWKDTFDLKKAKEILSISNPLEAEKAILGEYFDFLSSHPVSSPFSLDALIIYGLKLQIKERVAAFSEEKGREEFDRLYRDIQSVITSRSDYGL